MVVGCVFEFQESFRGFSVSVSQAKISAKDAQATCYDTEKQVIAIVKYETTV